MDFIRHSWQQLASLAWNEYRQRGVGAVVIDFATATNPHPKIYRARAFYLGRAETPPSRLARFSLADETGMMSIYDPRQQVIFICLSPDGNLYSSLVAAEPAPPACVATQTVLAASLRVEVALWN